MAPKPFAVCASLLLAACGGNSPPPARSASSATPETASQPSASATPQSETKDREDFKSDLAAVDVRLKELSRKVEVARDDAKTNLTQQLDALQKRDDEVKAQLRTTEARGGVDAEKARRELREALVDLRKRLEGLADRIHR